VQRLTDAGVELLQRCAADGVRAVPLKGLHSLLAGTWPDPAMRTMVDLDVLVAADRAPDVFASLQAAGYDEHPEPIGEHADHHLPMLRREDITVEVHTELLVSRWRPLVPAASVLQRAMFRPTRGGTLLLAEDTDAFVHLVAHAQLQEETYTLFGLPLRALHETAQLRYSGPRYATSVDLADARDRFARVDRAHVLDAHLEAARRLFAAEVPEGRGPPRAAVHTLVAEGALAAPSVGRAWTYAVRLPRSFGEARMLDEFGPGSGPRWLWTSRARHAARRVSVHLGGREH
jgi:hypothetical protein